MMEFLTNPLAHKGDRRCNEQGKSSAKQDTNLASREAKKSLDEKK